MLSSLFPLSTAIGERIEKVTSETLPTEDWEAILEICQLITETENGSKDAIRAIQKRLSGKHPSVIHHTLVLLDACVKNCDERFHMEIASQDFLNFFVKLIFPKNTLNPRSKEKVLELLQSWSDAFGARPQYALITETVRKLRDQGVEFPAQDMDAMAPIYTPGSTASPRSNNSTLGAPAAAPSFANPIANSAPDFSSAPSPAMAANSAPAAPRSNPSSEPQRQPVYRYTLTPQQRAKLREDLTVVKENTTLFNEMLAAHEPGKPADSLLEEFYDTCSSMQKRVMSLFDQITDEDLIIELLRINDDLNASIAKYGDLTRNFAATRNYDQLHGVPARPQSSIYQQPQDIGNNLYSTLTSSSGYATLGNPSAAQAQAPVYSAPAPRRNEPESLIDFDSAPVTFTTLTSSSGTANSQQQQQQQQRNSAFYANPFATGSTYDDNLNAPQEGSLASAMKARTAAPSAPTATNDDDDPFAQLAAARVAPKTSAPPTSEFDPVTTASAPKESSAALSTSDFDDFLAERGFLQTATTTTAAAKSDKKPLLQSTPMQRRQLDMDERDDDLFGI